MAATDFTGRESRRFWALAALLGLVVLTGLGASLYLEENRHIRTGVNNRNY